MAVINTGHDIRERLSKPADKCTICGGCLGYPYLHWDGSGAGVDIHICGKCCLRIKDGFIMDLVQISATMELQAHDRRRGSTMLVRTTFQELYDEAMQKQEAEKKAAALIYPISRTES
jgi:hypothetical protein